MYEATVVLAFTEKDDISRAEMDTRIAAGEPIEHVVTKVYRFEFETEVDVENWLSTAADYTVHNEQLTA